MLLFIVVYLDFAYACNTMRCITGCGLEPLKGAGDSGCGAYTYGSRVRSVRSDGHALLRSDGHVRFDKKQTIKPDDASGRAACS